MKTITFLSQKGGVGKTTLATNIAAAARLDGYETLLVDLDPQSSAAQWCDDRGDDPPGVATQHGALERVLRRASEASDVAVIDSAPNTDRAAMVAAQCADLIVIPVTPSVLDLRAVRNSIELTATATAPSAVVLSQCRPRESSINEEAQSSLEALGAEVAPARISRRVAFEYAMIDGRSVLEYEPNGPAAEEVRALYEWMRKRVNL